MCFGNVIVEDKDEGMNVVILYKIIRDFIIFSNYNDSVIVIKEIIGELCSNEFLNIGVVWDFMEYVCLREYSILYEIYVFFIEKKLVLILLVFCVLWF